MNCRKLIINITGEVVSARAEEVGGGGGGEGERENITKLSRRGLDKFVCFVLVPSGWNV